MRKNKYGNTDLCKYFLFLINYDFRRKKILFTDYFFTFYYDFFFLLWNFL